MARRGYAEMVSDIQGRIETARLALEGALADFAEIQDRYEGEEIDRAHADTQEALDALLAYAIPSVAVLAGPGGEL